MVMQIGVVARGLGLADDDEPPVGRAQDLDRRLVQAGERLGRDHLVGRSRDRAAGTEVHDAVEVREDRVHVVGDDHHGHLLLAADLGNQRRHARLVGQVETVERLVEQAGAAGRRASACAMSSRCCSPPEHSPIGAARVALRHRRDRSTPRPDPAARAGGRGSATRCRTDRRRARARRCRHRGCAGTDRSSAAAAGSRSHGSPRRPGGRAR